MSTIRLKSAKCWFQNNIIAELAVAENSRERFSTVGEKFVYNCRQMLFTCQRDGLVLCKIVWYDSRLWSHLRDDGYIRLAEECGRRCPGSVSEMAAGLPLSASLFHVRGDKCCFRNCAIPRPHLSSNHCPLGVVFIFLRAVLSSSILLPIWS